MNVLFSMFMVVTTLSLMVHIRMTSAEVYSAQSEMEELIETEAELINTVQLYVAAYEEKLRFLKKRISEYQIEHNKATVNISDYLSNPINAFMLTKRLTSDWKSIKNVMSFDVGAVFLDKLNENKKMLKFPSEEDLNGIVVAMTRLQDTYQLDTASIARGELNGVQYSMEMSVNDCFEMGRQSYLNKDYYHTALWMREAMNRLSKDANQIMSPTRADILEYLAISIYKRGNAEMALNITNELLDLLPNHERASGNKIFYEKYLESDTNSATVESPYAKPLINDTPKRRQYEQLCRSEMVRSPAEMTELRCRYVTNKSAFLKIGPLKLEEVHLKPYIVIYHDVIYDTEIEVLKNKAKPRFKRATVKNINTGKDEVSSFRISKYAWLRDEDHRYVRALSLRVEDMTSLTISSAEPLQVINYGIGGHYHSHVDFVRKDINTFEKLGTGNRIATVLFYMSDVLQGGATVFPMLRVSLLPRKGTAAFWFNLHASGEGDYNTRHAACPVLTGSKWICNKWLHEKDQEFLRPCELQPDHPPNQM